MQRARSNWRPSCSASCNVSLTTCASSAAWPPAPWPCTATRCCGCRRRLPHRTLTCPPRSRTTCAAGWRNCVRAVWVRAASPSHWPPGAVCTAGGDARAAWPSTRWKACGRPRARSRCPRLYRWNRPWRWPNIRRRAVPPCRRRRWPHATTPSPNCCTAVVCGWLNSPAWTCRPVPQRRAGSTPPTPPPTCWARAASAAACPWAVLRCRRWKRGWRCARNWRSRARRRCSSAAWAHG